MEADEIDPQAAAAIEWRERIPLPHSRRGVRLFRLFERVTTWFQNRDLPSVGRAVDRTVPGPGGSLDARLYLPEGEGPFPTVVYFHGGGFVFGSVASHEWLCRHLANESGCGVLSVAYRLAPEHPFPVAVDEAAAAAEWVADNAAAFGGDPERLGVSGTSAGAALALATCLYGRELGDDPVELAAQFLCYPIAGHDFETDSYRENADGPLLTREDMRWFYDRYLRSPVDAHNPFAVPLRAADLGDLPAATVVTAGFDPLRDDGVALAERFEREGTPVEHRHYPAMAHGFCSLADRVETADEALSAVAGDVRERL